MSSRFSIEDMYIDGLKVITPFYAEDERGYFLKDFEKNVYERLVGGANVLSECFVSGSRKGVIRGMHFQIKNPQIKIISVLQGEVVDVALDLRRDSATFGKWYSIVLSEDNHKIFYIPSGFAHGFQALDDNTLVSYKCIGEYDAETDTGIVYNDGELDISWPDSTGATVSQRDKNLMTFDFFKRKYGGL